MCMENVKKWDGDDKPQKGYKVFRVDSRGGLVGCYDPESTLYAKGTWYQAGDHPARKGYIEYPPGFHIFFTREDADVYSRFFHNSCVMPVLARKLQHTGEIDTDPSVTDEGKLRFYTLKTFTAGEIMIFEEEKDSVEVAVPEGE